MIKKALEKAGYDVEPTEENLRECFHDFVDCGAWANLSYDDGDLDEYSIEEICQNFMRFK